MTGQTHEPAPAERLCAVIFDFHSTLVHGGDTGSWLEAGWSRAGRTGTATAGLGPAAGPLQAFLDRVWDHARVIDPTSARDLSPEDHHRVWDATLSGAPGIDPDLSAALYAVMPDQWSAYDDAVPTLAALRARGVRIAVLSNIGFELAPVLTRTGIAEHVDTVVMSWEVGVAKPQEAAFAAALERLGTQAEQTLMVGDSWHDDAAAAALGIRTLILPRTPPPVHGLGLVLRMVG